jgi:hypothetical protein
MTPAQQTKIAELLVNKLKQAHKQRYEEILPPSVLKNQIRQQMVMAGVVYELMREAFTLGIDIGYHAGNLDLATDTEYNFDKFLNNITK